MNIQQIKQRFGIIGNSDGLNRAIDVALQVAPTDLSVLINGESGSGKEVFPQIIHQYSTRKHGKYIAVNCGAIPEGTIDSELFGHEKGAFTGAHDKRKGYFEVADKGTIFLDEVSELPLETQVRLLRVLETGEFLKVGSSDSQKTDVRVVAATNINIESSIQKGKFREDLYYRLNTVPVNIPPIRERKDDILLLFRKFARDFAEKYQMPVIKLDSEAKHLLKSYRWPGNVRQLKNITEQISVIEENREIDSETLKTYLPTNINSNLPALINNPVDQETFNTERELLYKILFDMKQDVNDLKKLINEIIKEPGNYVSSNNKKQILERLQNTENTSTEQTIISQLSTDDSPPNNNKETKIVKDDKIEDTEEYVEESLSLEEKEKELIIKALDKHNNKRKYAAEELGISERTLYRKIKEYNLL